MKKRYYIERVDISYCYVDAENPEEAEKISGDGSNMPQWETIIGETIITEESDKRE